MLLYPNLYQKPLFLFPVIFTISLSVSVSPPLFPRPRWWASRRTWGPPSLPGPLSDPCWAPGAQPTTARSVRQRCNKWSWLEWGESLGSKRELIVFQDGIHCVSKRESLCFKEGIIVFQEGNHCVSRGKWCAVGWESYCSTRGIMSCRQGIIVLLN